MSEELTPARLAEIEARLKAATPGPWEVVRQRSIYTTATCGEDHDPSLGSLCCDMFLGKLGRDGGAPSRNADANAALIAHAPADLRALLDAHAAQAEEIKRLRAERDRGVCSVCKGPGACCRRCC